MGFCDHFQGGRYHILNNAERQFRRVAGKDAADVASAHMFCKNLTEEIPEIRRQRQIAAFKKLVRRQARPSSIHFAALHRTAEDEKRTRMTVIRSARSILANG